MLILITILVLLFLFLTYRNVESFINFRLPNKGEWCIDNDCNYPVISILQPSNENKNFIQKIEKSNFILPKNKNFNSVCLNCIIQSNNNCMYITINSKESIIKISDLFMKWFDLMEFDEKNYLMKDEIFKFKENNLYFTQIDTIESKEFLIKPSVITNDSDTVYADEIVIKNNEVNVSIEFYVLLLVIYYKLSKIKHNSKDLKYKKKDKEFIYHFIDRITKNFNFNIITDNQHIFNKKDDYYEKCNYDILSNDIPEKLIHDYGKNIIKQTSDTIKKSIASAKIKINSTMKKNEYLSKILDEKQNIKNAHQNRLEIVKKDNVLNEKCLNMSKELLHSENRYSKIDNQNYIYSCGNYFIDNESNQNKLDNCDKFSSNRGTLPSLCCLKPKQESYVTQIDNKIALFESTDGCSITYNKDTNICSQKEFKFSPSNHLKFNLETPCKKN
jgi:hypothetical protein